MSGTTALGLLNWRALYCTIGAKHAAVPFLWLQERLTILTFIKILARVRGHVLFLLMTTVGASDKRCQNYSVVHPKEI